jgi:hypothetical protein
MAKIALLRFGHRRQSLLDNIQACVCDVMMLQFGFVAKTLNKDWTILWRDEGDRMDL